MNHYDLCKKTAEWIVKKSHVCFFEYQSYATSEFPDVLAFKDNGTNLFEIKVSRQDFLKDGSKDCRQGLQDFTVRYKPRTYETWQYDENRNRQRVKKHISGYSETFRQTPHLGIYRYYVCPWGLIEPTEVNLFGLFWYREKDGKFFKKKDSKKFRRNLYAENNLLVHALRMKINAVEDKRVIAKPY